MTTPSMRDVAAQHRWSMIKHGCLCDDERTYGEWPAHFAAAWREVCTIRTVEQLDALPEGAIIRDRGGRVFEQTTNWRCAGKGFTAWWSETGEEGEASSDELDDLPALLIWSPDWEVTP